MTITKFNAINLGTHDTKTLAQFYRDKIGMEMPFEGYYDCHDGAILSFPDQKTKIIIWDKQRWEFPDQGTVILSFLVDNVDKHYQDLLEKEVDIFEEPNQKKWGGKIMIVTDPDKNRIVFFDREISEIVVGELETKKEEESIAN